MEIIVNGIKALDWSIIGVIVSGILSILGVLNAYIAYKNRSRNRLRTDLEILKHFEKEDLNYTLIKDIIDKNVKSIYTSKRIVHKWGELIFGVIYVMGFSIWCSSVYLKNGTSFGFYVLFSYIFNGIIIIVDSFIEQGIINKKELE